MTNSENQNQPVWLHVRAETENPLKIGLTCLKQTFGMFLVSIIALGLIICLSGLENEVKNGVHGREKKAGIHYFCHLGWAQSIGLFEMRSDPNPPPSMLAGPYFVCFCECNGFPNCKTQKTPKASTCPLRTPKSMLGGISDKKHMAPKSLEISVYHARHDQTTLIWGVKGGHTNVNDRSSTAHVNS